MDLNEVILTDSDFITISDILEQQRMVDAVKETFTIIDPRVEYSSIRFTKPVQSKSGVRKAHILRRDIGVSTDVKINRNELCPCDSGKKYKHCCLNSIPS